jgi:hypothetical protein
MGLGSGIRKNLFRISDPGSRGQRGTGSRIRIRNTGINIIDHVMKKIKRLVPCFVTFVHAVCVRYPAVRLCIQILNGFYVLLCFSLFPEVPFILKIPFDQLGTR